MKTIIFCPLIILTAVAAARGQPVITTQPVNQTNYLDTTATLTVAVTGTEPVTYHWQKYSSDFTDLANQTNAALTLTHVRTNDAADYRVVVTDATGTTNSVAAHLYVLPLPTLFISQPVPGQVTLSWSETNWVLVQSYSMSCSPAWLRVSNSSPITLQIGPGSDTMFFRLAALPLVGPSQSDWNRCQTGCVTCCESYVAAYLLNPEQASWADASGCASIGAGLGSCISAAQQEWLYKLSIIWWGP